MRIAVALLGAVVCFAASGHPGAPLETTRTRNGFLAVAVTLEGERVVAALDTGTTRTLVSPKLAERLALVPRARSTVVDAAGRARPLLVSAAVNVSLGGVPVRLPGVAWTPDAGDAPGAEGLDAVLGADVLGAIDLLVDAQSARVWAAPRGTLAAWVDGTEVPLRAIGGRLAVEVELAGAGRERLALIVDSGAAAPVLFGRAAAALRDRAARKAVFLVTAFGVRRTAAADLGVARAGAGWIRLGAATLLPELKGREEAGLLPLAALGPALIEAAESRAWFDVRLRATPRDASAETHFSPSTR